MKYADCPVVEVEVLVAVPPEGLWNLVADIDLPARFSSEFLGGTWLEGASGPAPGARFEGRNRHPAAGEWKSTSTIVACEPGRVLAWAVGDPEHPSASWRFELAPEAGGTRLRQWAQMGPGPSGLTPAIQAMPDKEERIVAGRLEEWRRNMLATVEGIKALAEGA
jgi:uncharacterized protein YndB with AHSA1/START domain